MSGYEESSWEFEAQSGRSLTHTFVMVPIHEHQQSKPEPVVTPVAPQDPGVERPVPIPVYVLLGVTGALGIGAGVTGVLAMGKRSDYDKLNERLTSEDERDTAQELKDSGERLNLFSDILLGATVAAGATTVILYLTRPEVESEVAGHGLRVTPLVSNEGAALSLSGAF
jgi:hypothetical protein